jgi:predicted enzyme related to lactoylglutathione lyase
VRLIRSSGLACELGATHFAIYQASEGAPSTRDPSPMVGFQVESFDDSDARALKLGAKVDRTPENRSWGRRAIVTDSDGSLVELNQE